MSAFADEASKVSAAITGKGPEAAPDSPLLGWGTPSFWEVLLPLNNSSNAYEKGRFIKTGPGLLFGFTVYSSNSGAQFVQLFDTNVLPTTGAIPCFVCSVNATADRAFNWITPRRFNVGIYIANSSTGPTFTAGSADCFFDVQFL